MSFGLFVYCVSNAMIAESIWQDKCRAYNLMYVILPLLLPKTNALAFSRSLLGCVYVCLCRWCYVFLFKFPYMSFACTKHLQHSRKHIYTHPAEQPSKCACKQLVLVCLLSLLLRWWIYSLISVDLQPVLVFCLVEFASPFSLESRKFHLNLA